MAIIGMTRPTSYPYSKGKVGAESLRVGFLRCPRRGVFLILFPVVAVSDLGVST